MKIRKVLRIFLIATILMQSVGLRGQEVNEYENIKTKVKPEFAWGVHFNTFFDNREGDDSFAENGTFFLTRLAPEVGIRFDGGTHKLMGGVSWTQPIGNEWRGNRISPVLYYKYHKNKLNFSLGFVPRDQLHHRLPGYIESDSVRYFQFTYRGGYVDYESDKGYFNAIIDWRGMQTKEQREAFCIIAGGEWRILGNFLGFGGTAMMNHLARTSDPKDDEHVVDNFVINPYFCTELSSVTPFKRFEIKLGVLSSINRDRGEGHWLNACGLWNELDVEWWRLQLHNTVYASRYPLFRLFDRYGALLYDGEPYYASKFYDRLAVSGLLLKWRDIVELTAGLDFNFTHEGMTFCQKITLGVNF